LDCKARGLVIAPKSATGDGALGFWKALAEIYPDTREQRCTVHKTANFPAEHWIHLRTTNPIESTFATVRHRQRRTKGNGSRKACLAMVFKLTQAAEKKWRLLNGARIMPDVIRGVRFVDGVRDTQAAA